MKRASGRAAGLYIIKARVWLYPGMAGWYFITLPKAQSAEIKRKFGVTQRAWGSLPVSAKIGRTEWRTSIFPDKKAGAYLLPIKAAVRKAERVADKSPVEVRIQIRRAEFREA